jgi:hypothetical protein
MAISKKAPSFQPKTGENQVAKNRIISIILQLIKTLNSTDIDLGFLGRGEEIQITICHNLPE